ncbi:hypothetical protein SAMN05216360_101478 [Methylobacterium phyllostachyos]|uniref:Uncharacterized protein n=1 Tax=Methylobacterium phyllostachyos TaxID=582672 RepID=A0A1G9S3I5_9HYPH|nr:hypothetical protein [Methylobacterium phyllostachyos]SDM29982.1 hypothetical protein SAMN05216360_101478 [Methylobacterium phyllostachyos]
MTRAMSSAAVTAHRSEARPASPRLIERLRELEDGSRARVDPQAVQIFASARRLLGDLCHLPDLDNTPLDLRARRSFAKTDRNHRYVPLE